MLPLGTLLNLQFKRPTIYNFLTRQRRNKAESANTTTPVGFAIIHK